MRIPMISLIAAGSLALGGCAYGGLGLGYGDGYSSYGYGSPYGYNGYGYGGGYGGYGYNSSYGYGSPYGYGGYGGYGYGSPYSGWYGNYYYPGTGYYVYDSYRRPVRWNDSQRSYWTQRIQRARQAGTTVPTTPNWGGFNRQRSAGTLRDRTIVRDRVAAARERIDQRREDRAATRVIRNSDDEERANIRRRPR